MVIVPRVGLLVLLTAVATSGLGKTPSMVFEVAARSTVVVLAYDESRKVISQGSGVALPSGDIATNCHVLKDGVRFSVKHHESEYVADRRHSDWDRDVCTLSTATKLPAASLGNTRTLKVGARVYAVGAPRGLELSLSDGLVASLRTVKGGQYIQTTAPISPGSSGGGLFDKDGLLLGLITFYLSEGQNLNFAVPVEWIVELPTRHISKKPEGRPSIDWFTRAFDLETKQQFEELLQLGLAWTRAKPDDPEAWFYLGNGYSSQGKPAQAVGAYQRALRIDPNDAATWYNLGIAYADSEREAAAVDAYKSAIRIDPDRAEFWYNLGMSYGSLGEDEKRIDAYKQAIRIDPEKGEAWNNLGFAYGKSGQELKAMEAFKQAIRVNPENANAWFNLGNSYGRLGQTADEIEAYREAIRIDPNNVKALYNLGVAYAQSDQKSSVTDVYRRLKTIDPELAETFFNRIVLP